MTVASASPVPLRTRGVRDCPVCRGPGDLLYEGLEDRLYHVPGLWNVRRCLDHECGLLWLDPAPVREDLPLAYARYHTHAGETPAPAPLPAVLKRWLREGQLARRFGYRPRHHLAKRALASLALAPFPELRRALERSVMHLPPIAGGRVLDVGCGEGRTLEALRDLGWAVEGVDFDAAAVQHARSRGLEVHCGGVEDRHYPDGRFHAIVLSHVLEHVVDPAALLRECRRILRNDGVVAIATPNAESLGHHEFGRDWRGLEPPRHLQVFTPASLARVAREAGFARQDLTSTADAARFMYVESARIAAEPGVDPAAVRAAAVRFRRAEAALVKRDPWCGEELLLFARSG